MALFLFQLLALLCLRILRGFSQLSRWYIQGTPGALRGISLWVFSLTHYWRFTVRLGSILFEWNEWYEIVRWPVAKYHNHMASHPQSQNTFDNFMPSNDGHKQLDKGGTFPRISSWQTSNCKVQKVWVWTLTLGWSKLSMAAAQGGCSCTSEDEEWSTSSMTEVRQWSQGGSHILEGDQIVVNISKH